MIKWAISLGEFDISYQQKPAEKGQVVADFITNFTYLVDIVSTPKELVSLPQKLRKYNQQLHHGVYMLMARPTNTVVEQD
ncbi:hypothetical protein ACFX2G_023576 [Malus domestica]